MHPLHPQLHTRRAFLRRTSQLGLAGTALPFALNLAAIGEAAAFTATDYKALVCVFLNGGNDYANTVITYDDDSYNRYSTIRGGGPGQTAGGIALAKAALTPTLLQPTVPLPNARQYALHPAMTGLTSLFNQGVAAVQLNVGPLVVPLTRDQYKSADRTTFPLPPKLFSHNDQQSVWQSSSPEGSTVGWGGKIGDLALSSNGNSLFTCMSVTGNAVFLSGTSALQYQVSTGGAIAINGVKSNVYGSAAVRGALTALIQQPRTQMLENEYNRITGRAVSAETQITTGLAGVTLATAFPTGNSLADQLKMVARLIGARSTLGSQRQVFMVSLGGFDLHDNLISQQPVLMQRVSEALTAFYNATVELGVADKVTAFTASDFGRTLSSNGDGSDHGWGSHHLVVGGAVRGKAFYGNAPPVSITNTTVPDDQWHVGQGRLLPSTSVDQYAATLAKWFGVTNSEISSILPNIVHFGQTAGRPDYPTDLGFMA
ncbi:MAG: Tat pathway signal protein [Verminephrobacter sp.]|nr:Tat pathway signal protein [Verminephrobacter sp.]